MNPRLLLPIAALLAVIAIACGGGDDSSNSTNDTDPQKLLTDAAAAAKQLKSFHFKLTHENGGTAIPLGLTLTAAEGDVAIPDRIAAKITANAGPLTSSVDVIGINDQLWITNPFTRRWQTLPGNSASDFADPRALVDAIVASISNPQVVDETKLGEITTTHLRGTMDSGALQDALSAAQPGHELTVDLWIGPDNLVRRAKVTGPIRDGEAANIARQIELSRFNDSVQISPPV
jgi:hypothetical protein